MSKEAENKLIKSILDENVRFFCDKDNPLEVYVEYPERDGSPATVPVRSQMFRAFLGYQYMIESGEDAPPDFEPIIQGKICETQYLRENMIEKLRRVTGSLTDGKIAYFLADDQWSTLFIKGTGWKVAKSKKVKFTKSPLDAEQVMPVGGGDLLSLLRKYVNLDDVYFFLFRVYVIQAFSRTSSHFAAIISSEKGTGKSTLTKLLRDLIDPSKAGVPLMPSNDGDLKTYLADSYVVCFDNTAVLSTKFSNILCAAITGSKAAKRKLYTDCDHIILNLHNMVVINGIDIVPYQSDLAERSLLFELRKISEEKRITDAAFWAAFKKDRPMILGAILDTLVKAIQILPTIQTKSLHRMADANLEMIAIAVALGKTEQEFQEILGRNNKKLQESYAENNAFVNAIVDFIRTHGNQDAPASKIYDRLRGTKARDVKDFPNSASALSKRLNREKDALEQMGIRFAKHKQNDFNYITLTRIPQNQQTKSQRTAAERRARLMEAASTDD